MSRDPESFRRLDEELATLFGTVEDSRRIVEFVGLDPGRIAFDPKAITNWSSILREAAKHGLVEKIVDHAVETYPDRESLLRGSLARRDDPFPVEKVTVGLDALVDFSSQKEVLEVVVEFQSHFKHASEQIEVVANYKDLHDRLHELQFRCYDPMAEQAKGFPEDDSSMEFLAEYERALIDLIEDLREIASRESISEAEVTWIEEWLLPASRSLRGALENRSRADLKRALWEINRVLARQPGRINDRLNAGARSLGLPKLIQALKDVQARIGRRGAAHDKAFRFSEGITAMERLHQNLAELVDDHGSWQETDRDFRRIAGSMDHDTVELELTWPTIETRLRPLCCASQRAWAKRLTSDCDALSEALSGDDEVSIRRHFRFVHRETSKRFYHVDLALKRQCDELRKVGAPLDGVLELVR